MSAILTIRTSRLLNLSCVHSFLSPVFSAMICSTTRRSPSPSAPPCFLPLLVLGTLTSSSLKEYLTPIESALEILLASTSRGWSSLICDRTTLRSVSMAVCALVMLAKLAWSLRVFSTSSFCSMSCLASASKDILCVSSLSSISSLACPSARCRFSCSISAWNLARSRASWASRAAFSFSSCCCFSLYSQSSFDLSSAMSLSISTSFALASSSKHASQSYISPSATFFFSRSCFFDGTTNRKANSLPKISLSPCSSLRLAVSGSPLTKVTALPSGVMEQPFFVFSKVAWWGCTLWPSSLMAFSVSPATSRFTLV
mmetsp:Transcript_45312/g.127926  ORF Transcript_45312/g.127926 Transcript_45312/m.127926 type:complete len:314 (+) Transcript_45312:2476-3417(+)